jgi:hypothetical protein
MPMYKHIWLQSARFQKFVWFSIIYFPQCHLNSAEENFRMVWMYMLKNELKGTVNEVFFVLKG